MPEDYPELEIGDPFDFFIRQAHRLSRTLFLPIENVAEVVEIVRGAFGDAWIRGKVESRTQGTPLPEYTHTLGRCFGIAGDSQVVSVFEIAVYLKHLCRVYNLQQVIDNMRAQWGAGLLQLAIC